MDGYDWNILSDAYDKAKAELATLRAEVEKWKRQAEISRLGACEITKRESTLRAQLEDFRASQQYRYIGKDGKPVLARSLEDDRDRLRAENEKLKSLMLHYEAVNRARREWHYQISRVDGHPTAVMITQAELEQALNALDQVKEALK